MSSFRSRILAFTMKHRHIFQGRLKPEVVDWNSHEAILRFREQCEAGARRFGKLPGDIRVQPLMIGGMPAEWISLSGVATGKVILFFHGGGYVSGSCSDHRIHVSKFVSGSGIPALIFEYRLAPEHAFPAAIDDSIAAYEWLLRQGKAASDIVFAGDSAGGGLCLATLLAVREKALPMPAAAVALSPWTDLTCSGRSYVQNATRCLSPEGTWTAFSRLYAGTHDPALPLISPLFGNLNGLPPLLIYAGADEILLDDSLRFAEKAKQAGVDVTLRVGDGLFHCYPVCAPMFPEATEAMREICGFITLQAGKKLASTVADPAAGH